MEKVDKVMTQLDSIPPKKVEELLVTARALLEGKMDGAIIISPLKRLPNGLEVNGMARVNNVPQHILLEIALEQLNLDVADLMGAAVSQQIKQKRRENFNNT